MPGEAGGARRGPLAATARDSGQREREKRVKGNAFLLRSFSFSSSFAPASLFFFRSQLARSTRCSSTRDALFISQRIALFPLCLCLQCSDSFSSTGIPDALHRERRRRRRRRFSVFFCKPEQCSAAQQPSWRRGPCWWPRARSALALQRAPGRRQGPLPRLSAPRRSSLPLVPRRLNGQLRRRRSSALPRLLRLSSSGALGALPPTPRRRQRTRKGWPRPRVSASRRSSRRSSS